MEDITKNFYRNFYIRTGGYFPSKPLEQSIHVGDFFQIRRGELVIFGNIFSDGLAEPDKADLNFGNRLNPASWTFSDGVSKPYSGRDSGQSPIEGNFEYSKQVLSFAHPGSFVFKAQEPESVKIGNWTGIRDQLLIRLTQTYFSFRELYLVTESAVARNWALAIGAAAQAELEIATDTENSGLVDIFGHPATRTIQARDIGINERVENGKPYFFKAQKLAASAEKTEAMVSNFISRRLQRQEWLSSFYQQDNTSEPPVPVFLPHADMHFLDLLPAGEPNPDTALQYFRWIDTTLDDIEKLYAGYER